jgi:hypothetical protein
LSAPAGKNNSLIIIVTEEDRTNDNNVKANTKSNKNETEK